MEAPKSMLQRMRILLVDDQPIGVRQCGLMLTSSGHDVESAGDPRQAVWMLERGPAYGLIITDQEMPGMTGLQLTAFAKKMHPAAKIWVVSASMTSELAVQAMRIGADKALAKEELTGELRAHKLVS